jgi:hypothetical protein
MDKPLQSKGQNRYKALIEKIFFEHYTAGSTEIGFDRDEIPRAAESLGIQPPKNLGDAIYSIRYRTPMPESILVTQPKGMEWIIEGTGRSQYVFKLVPINRIIPNPQLVTIKIPDSTPEIVSAYALSDEQALLAKIRYNRLLDIFVKLVAYSLQNHLRTTVGNVGQVEIDEIYVGIDSQGCQYVLPVQAKGGNDQLSVVQTKQDIACCAEKFPELICRAISAQFMEDDLIAMFELTIEDGHVRVVDEKHYKLLPASQISDQELRTYAQRL